MKNIVILLLLIVGLVSAEAANLRIASNCSYSEDAYDDFKIREMSFRMDNGSPSIRIYARNSDKTSKTSWNPLDWSLKMKTKAYNEALPANLVIQFDKGETLEALSFYSALSSLFHEKKIDVVRTCGGEVDTRQKEEISLTLQWGKEGSIRFW